MDISTLLSSVPSGIKTLIRRKSWSTATFVEAIINPSGPELVDVYSGKPVLLAPDSLLAEDWEICS